MNDLAPFTFRTELRDDDEATVRDIVASTGFFSTDEQNIAVELVAERRAKGPASGYHFVFLDLEGRTVGYTCHGPIPATRSSFDLYWIAVAASARRHGFGRALLARTEREMTKLGGTHVWVDTSSRAAYVPTRAFYRKMGYTQAAELHDFYGPGDGKVIFTKVLAQAARPQR